MSGEAAHAYYSRKEREEQEAANEAFLEEIMTQLCDPEGVDLIWEPSGAGADKRWIADFFDTMWQRYKDES